MIFGAIRTGAQIRQLYFCSDLCAARYQAAQNVDFPLYPIKPKFGERRKCGECQDSMEDRTPAGALVGG